MPFNDELEFETEVIKNLCRNGWEPEILKFKTEKDLIRNWANILFENNRDIDRLNDFPLTDGEMAQVLEQITSLRSPLKLNGFINGKTIAVKRDNPDDKLHCGKEVSLKIYDRQEIALGQSRYQIAEQPVFNTPHPLANNRRGDLLLLINGMPVIHIELKKSGVPVSQAFHQIEKYSFEGVFTGLFSLIQVFVAMTPEETVYFANPGIDGKFNPAFYFHWEDFNNVVVNDYKRIIHDLLSIPMAHQLIGFYTVADDTDGVLKVMRSYQYYAASAISNAVAKHHWDMPNQRGGYVWHTTGSGKTMTSFKSAQLIATSKDADKVVFLMDRIELGTQSLLEYRGFADEDEPVQATEHTYSLLTKLKSSDPSNTLIVTSIQKMSRIKEDGVFNDNDIAKINAKRIVFIVDECHRSTFGDMLNDIKSTFPDALFFGFSGTPIFEENQKEMSTTADIFGDELHRYSIADGIRDGNVLGFDPYKIATYSDSNLRKAVALSEAKASSVSEAMSDPSKKEVYLRFMNSDIVPMVSTTNVDGSVTKGIEDYIPISQYEDPKQPHHEKVVDDILGNWEIRSVGGKFHAIFAVASIPEAIRYYSLFKEKSKNLHVFAQFDSSIDNDDNIKTKEKENALLEMLSDYNAQYETNYGLFNYDEYKKDVALRLAHKGAYSAISNDRKEQIDILIVVDQMLTGFDSKWVNTLYLDKLLKAENIVQAFSRTNRIFGTNEKPHGTVCWYRKVHTMEKNVYKAFELYSGNKPYDVFVARLAENVEELNKLFKEIHNLFRRAGAPNFEKLPKDEDDKKKFASLFNRFNRRLASAKIQGFDWKKIIPLEEAAQYPNAIVVDFRRENYDALIQRYKELERERQEHPDTVPFDIDPSVIEINTAKIDADYLNSKFKKYIKSLQIDHDPEEIVSKALDDLSGSFATLSQEDQKYANIFLRDVQLGKITVEADKTISDYITMYKTRAMDDQIHRCSEVFGVNEEMLRAFSKSIITEANLNEFGRFDNLLDSADKVKAKTKLEEMSGEQIPLRKVRMKLSIILKAFILSGGFDL